MFLIIQMTAALLLTHFIIIWPQLREDDRKAARERDSVDREMARDRERHARSAAAMAALEPELAKSEPRIREMFLGAWESGSVSLTSESLKSFIARQNQIEQFWKGEALYHPDDPRQDYRPW